METNRLERGQVLVLIILAIVAIFGFAALAIDLGRLYSERRRLQNAADTAAISAAFAGSQNDPSNPTAFQTAVINAALDSLQLNDIFDTDPNPNPTQPVDVEIYNPPISGPYGPSSGLSLAVRSTYYQIIIHSNVGKVFSQFVFAGPLNVTVEAIARSVSAQGLMAGDVLHATSTGACGGLFFQGNNNTIIRGGDIFSDSTSGNTSTCPNATGGGASCQSGVKGGSGTLTVTDGTINTAGTWWDHGSGSTTSGGVNQCVTPKSLPQLPPPNCSIFTGSAVHNTTVHVNSDATLDPGVYKGGIQVNGDKTKVHLNPGLYCLDGTISMNGGEISGKNVLFFMNGGSFEIGGSTYANLQAPQTSQPCNAYDANNNCTSPITTPNGIRYGSTEDPDFDWNGMLIYMPYDNTGEVHIGGGSGSDYSGTILAPGPRQTEGQDKCVIEGTGTSIGLNSNVICYTIKVAGTAKVDISYSSDSNFRMPPVLELSQ